MFVVCSKANVNEESLLEDLDLINGGGSFSHREIACLVWKESSDAPTCIPFNDAISNYNALNIYSAMFTAADVMNHAQIMHVVDPVATVVPPLITGKALILGLGGGELFTVLSQAFPFLHIDSVDISKEVVINAWKYFGIKYLLCSVAKLSATTGKLEDITEEFRNLDPWTSHESQLMSLHHRLEVLHHKYHQYRDVYKSDFVYNTTSAKQMMDRLQPEDFSCRANVVLSDAWLFIRWKYEHILRQEARIRKYYQERQLPFTSDMYASVDYYDFVFIDVYSDLSTVWNGEKFQGESNSDVDEVITHLDMLQRVLRPFTGVVIFHVHKDKNFQRYYEHVVQKFSARQVTSFEVCANDAIFTVSRERFFRLNDLQTQEQKCNSETTVSGEEITSQCRPSWTEEKRTFDATAEVISPHSPQFRAHIHPCDVEDKSLLAKESAMLGNKLKLNPRYYYSFLASLNCYPFAYDEEESS